MLDISTLETWLWDAACAIRGPVDAPKFKDYILPLIFLKRLSERDQKLTPRIEPIQEHCDRTKIKKGFA
jgi:type I restriction enzyme M protein